MKRDRSNALYEQALKIIPGGVNSPVRACKSVGSTPLFIDRAQGSLLYDADGNEYIDYIGSWGPMILGHRHPDVIEAIQRALERGTSFGAPTDLEIELACLVIEAVESVDVVRMVNSGTEASMSAIRLARGVTGRDVIIKFDGCYHGHADAMLVEAGSGIATLGIPGSPGVPEAFVAHTISLPYNDVDAVKKVMNEKSDTVAGIIVEPVAGNMGLVLPREDFLETLREETRKHGSLLIFDEVMTGFRVALGGAQAIFGITPDISCFGKIIGGGLPVGAYGGRKDIMAHVAPQGSVYQAGTLSGNPVAMAAGIATLQIISQPDFFDRLDRKSARLHDGLSQAARQHGIPVTLARSGSMLGMFFTDQEVQNFDDARTSNLERFTAYYNGMLANLIYLAPSQFEALFVSAAHTDEQIDATIAAADSVFASL